MIIYNKDMRSKDYGNIKNKFRPGHADFTYFKNMELEIIEEEVDNQLERLLVELQQCNSETNIKI